MKTITVTSDQWEQFLKLSRLQTVPRRDWIAVISTNSRRSKWSFATYKRTPERQRYPMRRDKIIRIHIRNDSSNGMSQENRFDSANA